MRIQLTMPSLRTLDTPLGSSRLSTTAIMHHAERGDVPVVAIYDQRIAALIEGRMDANGRLECEARFDSFGPRCAVILTA